MSSASIFLESVALRSRANALARRTSALTAAVGAEVDHAVLLRTRARRLIEEAMRRHELDRENEAKIYLPLACFGRLVDGELCEDPALLSELNALGCECDKCGDGDSISAVIRFESMAATLAVCGRCFQDLTRLSLGQVT